MTQKEVDGCLAEPAGEAEGAATITAGESA
jgi:hypothetical protein